MEKHNYLCGALVERAYAEAGARHAKAKEADRAARRELHRVAGAFFSREEAKRAEKLLAAWPEGGDEALSRILSLHASTRERLPLAAMDALYAQLFEMTGKPRRVLDLACGLNPVYLAARGVSVLGLDAHLGAVALVNRFAEENGLDARAEGADLRTAALPNERFDLALVFKLLPLLGAEGYALLKRICAEYVAVSFPTRTLSGRSVGMERSYSSAFEEHCPQRFAIADRFVAGNELIYILKER